MRMPLYLFCGGPAYDMEGRPKPLMKIQDDLSLLVYFLVYIKERRLSLPSSVTLLCDDGQEDTFKVELEKFSYPVPIHILTCGERASTFEKFSIALKVADKSNAYIRFGYPDIFFFDEFFEPRRESLDSDQHIHISTTPLTSRFPRLIIDVLSNKINGISNYSSPIPANPLYVFGGDLWGRTDLMLELVTEFQSQGISSIPTLEYDFFFWAINQKKMHCVILYGEMLLIDSIRNINRLLTKMDFTE